jgi:hypothetical protein
MRIDKRLTELERRFHGNVITLTMNDGSVRVIHLGRGQDASDLFARTLNYPDSAEARLIAESVSAIEPGGSKIVEVIRVLLTGPAEAALISQQESN